MKLLWKLILLLVLIQSNVEAADSVDLETPTFGPVKVYRSDSPSVHPVLLFSDERGWDGEASQMAEALASQTGLVIGVDLNRYIRPLADAGKCAYPASDFENLSRFVQQKMSLSSYSPPALIGCGSGGALVYIVLVQAPPGTFLGGLSLGFDPTPTLLKAVCRGLGFDWENAEQEAEPRIIAAKEIRTPWMLLPSKQSRKPTPETASELTKGVTGATLIEPSEQRADSSEQASIAQIKSALASFPPPRLPSAQSSGDTLGDLPIVELPAEDSRQNAVAVILSGDGGWAGIDREIGLILSSKGIPVVGLNSLQYFWSPRTPEGASKDLERIIRRYLETWKKTKVILIGYSFGADVLPFLVSRLPSNTAADVETIALLGPSNDASFEFHLTDWVGGASQKGQPILPEIEKLRGKKLLCIYGEEEADTLCRNVDPKTAQILPFAGSHHFGGAYDKIAEAILKAAANPTR